MLNRFNPKLNVSHLDLYDAATLTSEKSWSQSPRLYYDYSISDKGIAALQKPGIVAADFGQTAWAVVGRAIGNCGGNLPTLYCDDQLVYGCTKLVAASSRGQVLMTDVLRDGEQAFAKKAVAQRGRFVAVSLDTTEVKQHIFSEATMRVFGNLGHPPGLAIGQITVRKKSLVNRNKPRGQRKSGNGNYILVTYLDWRQPNCHRFMPRATAPLEVCKALCRLKRYVGLDANWLQNG